MNKNEIVEYYFFRTIFDYLISIVSLHHLIIFINGRYITLQYAYRFELILDYTYFNKLYMVCDYINQHFITLTIN